MAQTVKKKEPSTEIRPWKVVLVSGTPAVLIGAMGGMVEDSESPESEPIVGQEPSSIDEPVQNPAEIFPEIEVVSENSDDMSFSEAFNAARAELGPGATFEWHGNLYSTYNSSEWEQLSDSQKNDYAEEVIQEAEITDVAIEVESNAKESVEVSLSSDAEYTGQSDEIPSDFDVRDDYVASLCSEGQFSEADAGNDFTNNADVSSFA